MKNYNLRYLPIFENDLNNAVSYIVYVSDNPYNDVYKDKCAYHF